MSNYANFMSLSTCLLHYAKPVEQYSTYESRGCARDHNQYNIIYK